MAAFHHRAVLLLLSEFLLLGIFAGCSRAQEARPPRIFDDIISFGDTGKPDKCCTADAPTCCGRTCMDFDGAFPDGCPVKQACCVPPDEEPTFDDCCDLYNECCGAQCIPNVHRLFSTAVYRDCSPVEGGCCDAADAPASEGAFAPASEAADAPASVAADAPASEAAEDLD